MARNINGVLTYDSSNTSTFTVAGLSTQIVDVDLWGTNNVQFLVEGTYAATASSTGIGIDIYYGFGQGDPLATGATPCVLGGSSVPKFSDNKDSVTTATFTASSGSTQTKRTYFALNDLRIYVPRWIRLKFTNSDSHTCTIKIYSDT